LQDKLNSYLSPGLIDNLSEEKENEIKNLIRIKSDKLKEIKKTHKEFNSRFNNGLKSQTLNRKALITDAEGKRTVKDVTIDKQLEESIKGDKERLTKIKEYRKIFSNLVNGQATKQDLDKLKKNNRLYNKQLLEETVLPYYVSFNKDELIQAFDNDPDLLLGMFSILEDMGYVGDIQNYKNVNLDTLLLVRSAFRIEDGQEAHHQVFGQGVSLIKEKSYFVTLHDGQEDLLKEHLIVFDCARVEFQHGARLVIDIRQRLAKGFKELSLAKTLRAIQQKERNNRSLLVRFSIEL
jgi:hypothetical protein